MARTSFTVTELNAHIKQLLDADVLLGNVCVTGELSNYKVYPSGHHYFTLKDAESSLRCVMFRSSAQSLRFRPASGMSVAAIGRIAVYPRDGAYQLYCTRLIPGGVGDLYAAYEQLKEQLQKEGLFDRAHKKPLPLFPQRIAVITSAAGAAVRDIIRVLGKRWPASEVVLLPVRVQGTEAPAEIAGAIRYANRYRVGDLIITGRGGGSIEDLWAFNDERVARAIYDLGYPGHFRRRARAGCDDLGLCGRRARRHALERGRAGRARPGRADVRETAVAAMVSAWPQALTHADGHSARVQRWAIWPAAVGAAPAPAAYVQDRRRAGAGPRPQDRLAAAGAALAPHARGHALCAA